MLKKCIICWGFHNIRREDECCNDPECQRIYELEYGYKKRIKERKDKEKKCLKNTPYYPGKGSIYGYKFKAYCDKCGKVFYYISKGTKRRRCDNCKTSNNYKGYGNSNKQICW